MTRWLGEWPQHLWQVWDYTVSHAQLHLRGIPEDDLAGPRLDLVFKPVYRIATSTMTWSGLRIALRGTGQDGCGRFFLVSARPDGAHTGHGVIRAGSLHLLECGSCDYFEPVLNFDPPPPWQTLWRSDR